VNNDEKEVLNKYDKGIKKKLKYDIIEEFPNIP
jgi:hypothetical protein